MTNTKKENKAVNLNTERVAARPRSATNLKLQWVAEKVRKIERIKRSIAEGSYKVDSRVVAKAILNTEE